MLKFLTIAARDKAAGSRWLRLPTALAIVLGLSLPVLAADGPPPMAVPGQFNVGASGAASYAIPIAVPPGTAGMVPSVSLNYSSQSHNGAEGWGWSLGYGAAMQSHSGNTDPRAKGREPTSSTQPVAEVTSNTGVQTTSTPFGSGGLSGGSGSGELRAIVRCPRTLAQNGVHGGVNYDANDRLCMDGQQLIWIGCTSGSSCSYGTDLSIYRTEIDTFAKIIEHGSFLSSTSYFEVHTKSAQTLQFGNTADSVVVAVGIGVPRAWALSSVADTKTNYLTITYDYDSTNGEAYPLRIDYTGNIGANVAAYNSVRFVYSTTRTDVTPYYQAGAMQQVTHLLTDIETYEGSNLVLDYKLAYRAGTTTTHSRLISVQLCDASRSTCVPTTTFTWQGGTGAVSFSSTSLSLGTSALGFLADINGDGIPDTALGTFVTPCFNEWQLYTGNPTGGFSASTANYFCPPAGAPQPVNLTGSQLSDFMFSGGIGGNSFAVNTGSGMSVSSTTFNGTFWAGDYNGDGRTDFYSDAADNPTSTSVMWLSNGNGTFSSGTPFAITWGGVDVADFDGDGCTDVIYGSRQVVPPLPTSQIDYSCSPAISTLAVSEPLGFIADGVSGGVIGDFNGDGKADLFMSGALNLSTGTGFAAQTFNLSTILSTHPSPNLYGGDFDGNGKTDLALWSSNGTTTQIDIYLATGTSFVNAGSQTISNGTSVAGVSDLNGDGASDIMLRTSTLVASSELITTYAPEVVTAIDNGIGVTTTVGYDRLDAGAIYTKGTGATYPTQDVENGMYVVSSVAQSNGVGGTYTTNYSYAGAKADLNGRGFLGFSTVTVSDPQTGIVQTTNYRTDFPYIGLVDTQTSATTITRNGCVLGTTLKSVANTYGVTPATTSPAPYFVFLSQSDVSGHDCDGTLMPSTRTAYTYDAYGNATQVAQTTYVGAIGSTVSSTSTANNSFTNDTTNWLFLLNQAAVTNVVGASTVTRTTTYAYATATDYLTQTVIEPGSSTLLLQTDYTLDAFGNRTATQTSGSNFTTRGTSATYDGVGRFMLTYTDEGGYVQHFTNDLRFGGLLTHTDQNGLITSWTYDTFGRMTLEARPDGMQTATAYLYCSGVFGGSFTCPTYGAFVARVTPQKTSGGAQNGPQSVAYFDTLGRAIASDVQGFSTAWIRASTAYDANGRVYQTSRPYFLSGGTAKLTTFTYDDLGRPTLAVMPDGSQTSRAYHGLVSSVTNNLSQVTTFTKNPQGLNASVTDPLTHVTSYTYDAFGNLATITDPSGNVTANTYDISGDKTAASDRDMGAWSYTYDGLGELKTQTDAKSQVTTLTYDLLGRVTQRAETGLTSTWTFGTTAPSIGRLVTATTSAGYTRALTYDSLSRPSTTTLTIGGTNYLTTTTYDTTNGQIATVARPSGFTETRVYTSLGYLSQLKDGSTSLFTVTTRDAELHLTQSTAGNSVVTTAAFDLDTGLPQTLRAGTGGGVASFDYAYDTVGNLVGRTDNDMIYTERFCYDALNRLTSYQLTTSTSCPLSGGTAKTVTYDSLGNITAKSDVGSYTYPASGGSSVRPHAVSSITGTVNAVVNPNYHYDANGNLDCVHTGSYPAGCTGGGAVRKIVSTSFNMADTITDGTTTVAFTYDSEHSRIVQASTVGGVTTTTSYLNDPASGAMSEKAVTGLAAIWTDYLLADGQIVAQRTAGLPPSVWNSFTWGAAPWTAPAAWSYFSLDPLSSIAVIADQNGTVAQRLSYDAWGKPRNSNGTDAACGTISSSSTRGFTNQEQIAALCAVNLNARIYDPTIARFLTPDDVVADVYDGQALNRFTYVDNRPLSLVDPSGNYPLGIPVEGSGPFLYSATITRNDAPDTSGFPTDDKKRKKGGGPMDTPGTTLGEPPVGEVAIRTTVETCSDDMEGCIVGSVGSNGMAMAAAWPSNGGPPSRGPIGRYTLWGIAAELIWKMLSQPAGESAEDLEKLHKHHSWPMYLGGAQDQALTGLPRSVHMAYHSGLDKIAPRQRGADYYANLTPEARQKLMKEVAEYTREFDAEYGTQLYQAMVKNGFPTSP